MEMNQTNRLEKPKYLAISAAALLVTALVLVQPAMQTAYAVGIEGLPGYDDCGNDNWVIVDDPISMNTVRNKDIVKTIHAEKEIFYCHLNQGNLNVTVDVTTYLEVYENITSQKVISTGSTVTTCLKDGNESSATVIDCESYSPDSSPVPVGADCDMKDPLDHPQEMNTVNKGNHAKTIEAQKEVYICNDIGGSDVTKKVDIVNFTEIYEDLNTQEITSIQFLSARCVILVTDDDSDTNTPEDRDGRVESCIFTPISN